MLVAATWKTASDKCIRRPQRTRNPLADPATARPKILDHSQIKCSTVIQGHEYTDLNFDALLVTVHQLTEDADAILPVQSQLLRKWPIGLLGGGGIY